MAETKSRRDFLDREKTAAAGAGFPHWLREMANQQVRPSARQYCSEDRPPTAGPAVQAGA
jgi:hypothetical protein